MLVRGEGVRGKREMDEGEVMGREEGGGFRMGTQVYLWWIHFDIWQN